MATLAALVLAVSGCGLLPTSGPVVVQNSTSGTSSTEQTYFYPPSPARGAGRAEIVRGFLVAMQANPINTGPARSFLSAHARPGWKPDAGVIVYENATVRARGQGVVVRLSDVRRLDASGVWLAGGPRTMTLTYQLVRDHGQWRIDNPTSALMVRSSFFAAKFVPADLYFFDNSGRVLVPETVYVPTGQLAASALVRGLLGGPASPLDSVARSAFPSNTTLSPAVTVNDNAVAEVPLSEGVLALSQDERDQALIQLSHTLVQLPGIERVRITVNGTPLAVKDGRTDIGTDEGAEFAPTGLNATRDLLAVREGRVVIVDGRGATAVTGGFGRRGLALRSLALDRSGSRIVAVAQDGAVAFSGDLDAAHGPVSRIFTGGSDLLRPRIDLFGSVWLVDRTRSGAVVHVIDAKSTRTVRIPGVSGRSITAFAISPDGTRIAADLAGEGPSRVVVSMIERDRSGRVLQGSSPQVLDVNAGDPAHRVGPVVDIGWRTPTMLAVLSHPTDDTSRVIYLMSDGSPGDPNLGQPDIYQGVAKSLVVNADSGLTLMLLDDKGRLARIDAAGKWDPTSATGLLAATYAD
jgi:hypothetical protein